MDLNSLILRLTTAADRGYDVAKAADYALMLGGDGSETSASELLNLAMKAKDAGLVIEPAPVAEPELTIEPEKAPVEEDQGELFEEEKPLEDMTKAELVVVAQGVDLPRHSRMLKAELLAALQARATAP